MRDSGKSLKARNLPWLCAVVGFDALALAVVVSSALDSASLTGLAGARISATLFLPIFVLVLTALLPSNWKAVLVFWRLRDVLPGHRAFSVHAPADARIDLNSLRKNVGVFPQSAREQNSLWYKLYTKVESETSVVDSHKAYLLFRDIAALSLLLAILFSATLLTFRLGSTASWAAAALFGSQYILAAISARNSGVRFVTNVLAVHSTKRVTKSPREAG